MKTKFYFQPEAFYIGMFWDRWKRRLYLQPLPMLGVMLEFPEPKPTIPMNASMILLALMLCCAPASAATIDIDDSDPATMTIAWSGFDVTPFTVTDAADVLMGGGTADGLLILADAGYNLFGAWSDTTPPSIALQTLWLAFEASPLDVTSGIIARATFTGGVGTLLDTTTGGYNGGVYFSPFGPTSPQDAPSETLAFSVGSGAPRLTGTFTSEAPPAPVVPEPATATLAGIGALGLIWYRRRLKG